MADLIFGPCWREKCAVADALRSGALNPQGDEVINASAAPVPEVLRAFSSQRRLPIWGSPSG